jgi:exodeoxyribonuclease VII large subunit
MGRIRATVEADPLLTDVWVEGEVSNFSQAASGHCYFTLKDAAAELRCVMWRDVAQALRDLPGDGDRVLAHGHVGVYERRGSVQLYVDHAEPSGVGALYREFERLRAQLEKEGLFAPERKRPLPRFPRRIGVVTSPIAAAFRDILDVLSRRYPLAQVLLAPTLVQGDQAPDQIVAALERLNARDDVDVIIVARGGGSLEELWAFNEERVARAVAASRTPLICGVGHETDYSLADFAADCRAPTPSAAAEIATPDQEELRGQIASLTGQLGIALQTTLKEYRWALMEQAGALRYLSPAAQLTQARQRTDDLAARTREMLVHELSLNRERLAALRGQLEGISPLATLGRGYAIVRRLVDGEAVQSVGQVTSGDALGVRVSDGEFEATAD